MAAEAAEDACADEERTCIEPPKYNAPYHGEN